MTSLWPRARMVGLCALTAWVLTACETHTRTQEPNRGEATTSQKTYGELQQSDGHITPLAEIATNVARYEGQQVQTEGEIERVCQKRGCWLELADASGTRVFVPMAGHAFVVPMDSVGREALVEGTVNRRERSEAERAHLKEDGAGESIPEVSITANAVVIR
ncbi:MAG: DUF4920 domain-containing protein [Myxococcota bacterium]